MEMERALFEVDVLRKGRKVLIPSDTPLPQMLYKYFGNIDYAIAAIEKQQIHLESPTSYNDYYDSSCAISFSDLSFLKGSIQDKRVLMHIVLKGHDKAKTEFLKFLSSLSTQDAENLTYGEIVDFVSSVDSSIDKVQLSREIIAAIPGFGLFQEKEITVSCFSECCDSILMWAYYAAGFSGVCLGFQPDKDMGLFGQCRKVIYDDSISADVSKEVYYYRKSTEWSHEKEWRLVQLDGAEFRNTSSISTIIVGNKISYEAFTQIYSLARQYQLDLFRIVPSSLEYKLTIEPLTKMMT